MCCCLPHLSATPPKLPRDCPSSLGVALGLGYGSGFRCGWVGLNFLVVEKVVDPGGHACCHVACFPSEDHKRFHGFHSNGYCMERQVIVS